jgi:hypothetical protein
MSSRLSRVARAKSEIRRKGSFTWSEEAIDIRCRIALSELDWPWADLELSKSLTPVEEVHAMSEYPLSEDVLCSVCQQFSLDEGTHQPDGSSLVKSASDGCQFCNMILDSFTANSQESLNILLEHDNPIMLNLRIDDKTTVRAGSRFFNHAARRLAVLTESINFLSILIFHWHTDTSKGIPQGSVVRQTLSSSLAKISEIVYMVTDVVQVVLSNHFHLD